VPESGSEVVLLEEEDDAPVAKKGKGRKRPADDDDVDLADVEEEEESSVSKALKGAKARHDDEEDEEEMVPAGAAAYRAVPWGPVPMIFLLPAFVLMILGGLMAFELLQTMTGYQQPNKPAAPLVQAVAGAFDMELTGQ
jgi:hypothetical protein